MPARSHVIADSAALARFSALGKHLLSQEEWAVFLIEDDLSPDARGKYEFSLPLIIRVSVFWLLRDLEQGTADVELLRTLVSAYHDHARHVEDMAHVRLSDSVVLRLQKILEHLQRLAIPTKTKSRHVATNRQLPLNVAVWYAYEKIKP